MIRKTITLALLMTFSTMIIFGMSVEIGGNPIIFIPHPYLSWHPKNPPLFPMDLLKVTDVTLVEPLSDNFLVTEEFSAFLNSTPGATIGIPFTSAIPIGGLVGARLTSNSIEYTLASPFKDFAEVDGGVLLAATKIFPLMNIDAGFLFELNKNMNTYLEIEYCIAFSDKLIFQNAFPPISPGNFFIMGGIDWSF